MTQWSIDVIVMCLVLQNNLTSAHVWLTCSMYDDKIVTSDASKLLLLSNYDASSFVIIINKYRFVNMLTFIIEVKISKNKYVR